MSGARLVLSLLHEGALVGSLQISHEEGEARFSLRYSDGWLATRGAFSLSVALPLREAPYGHLESKAYFENLLPEGEVIAQLKRYAQRRGEMPQGGLSDEAYFLRRFGVDCAGACVIIEGSDPPAPAGAAPALRPLDLEQIYAHLDARRPLGAELLYTHGGRFSLAGAQDKFPLIYQGGQLLIPTDGSPTTHILKPMIRGGLGEWNTPINELLCMRLAAAVGLRVPSVTLLDGPHPLYLVERFDRVVEGGRVRRVHQQDLCQAHGLTSALKYESDGGPRYVEHAQLIQKCSSAPIKDLEQLLKWLWFNLCVGNNDCHAKNLSLLTTPTGLRLAPFYDLLSTAAYRGLSPRFSYSIGGCWLWHDLKPKHIELLAAELGVPAHRLLTVGAGVAQGLSQALPTSHLPELTHSESQGVASELMALIQRRVSHLSARMGWGAR